MHLRKTATAIELALGVISLFAALALTIHWLRIGEDTDPHGFILEAIALILGMGLLLLTCGLLLGKDTPWAIVSQVILALAFIVFYIEVFTSYAGFFF